MKCPHCGGEAKPEQASCPSCGKFVPLPWTSAPAASQPRTASSGGLQSVGPGSAQQISAETIRTAAIDASALAKAAAGPPPRLGVPPTTVTLPRSAGDGPRLVCKWFPPIPLVPGVQLSVGRLDSCNVVVPTALVSRHHALIASDGMGGYHVTDLGSRNGTTVNGQPLAPRVDRPLEPDDVITFGNLSLRYVVGPD